MSLTDDLAAANTSLINFHTKFKQIADQKKPLADMAKDASAFNGVTPAAFLADLTSNLTTHIANKNNPHGDDATKIGAMKREDFDALAANYTDQGLFAVTQIGSLNYLPLGVSGSFESSTTVKTTNVTSFNDRESYSMQLESDGTLVFLRNATNGSKLGVFYGYIPAADAGLGASSKITPTNQRYNPSFISSGNNTAAYLYQGGNGLLAGRLQNASGVLGNCFIANTGGTLDSTNHIAVTLDGPTWDDILNRSEVVFARNNIYIFSFDLANVGADRTLPMDIRVWQIPLSSFNASGPLVTPTRVTVANCTGFRGKVFNTGDIRLADSIEAVDQAGTVSCIFSHNAASLFPGGYQIPGSGRAKTFSAINPAGTQIRTMVVFDARWNAAGKQLQQHRCMFSFVCDLATKTVTLDTGTAPLVLTDSGDGTTRPLTIVGPIIGTNNSQSTQIFGIDSTILNWSLTLHMADSGHLFNSQIAYNDTVQDGIGRTKVASFTSKFDTLKCPVSANYTEATRTRASIPIIYGSAIGDALDGIRLLPDNVVALTGRGSVPGSGVISSQMGVLARFGDTGAAFPATNYTYASVQNGVNIPGYKPRIERTGFVDQARLDMMKGMIMNVTASGSTVNGTLFNNRLGLLSRPTVINADLTAGGSTASVTQAIIEAAAKAVVEAQGFTWASVGTDFVVELVVPQNTSIPCWLSIVFNYNADNTRRNVLSLCTVNSRTAAITTVTPTTLIASFNYGVATVPLSISVFDALRCSAVHIYPATSGDGWMVVGMPTAMLSTGTGSVDPNYRFFINTNGTTEGAGFATALSANPGRRYAAWPGQGVGFVDAIDFATKLVFRKVAGTKTEFLTWNLNLTPLTSGIIVAAQDVAEGWTVYFTEDTPITIAGNDYILLSTSLDLSVLFPGAMANRVFYIYVTMTNGVPQWQISNTVLSESTSQIVVGTIVTGASGISSISVNKVTRIGNFRPSLVAGGSCIPVTGGTPDTAQSLPW